MIGFVYGRVGSPVNVGEQVFLYALDVVTNMLWGGMVPEETADGQGTEFRQVISELTKLLGKAGKPNVSDFYSGLARFDLQGLVKKTEGIAKRFDEILERVIDQRLRMKKEEEGSSDFLSFLVRLKDEGDSKMPLTMTHIKALFMDLMTAGTDTSSNTVEFAISEVMNNPEVLERINQELDVVVGRENIVEESHIHKLPYLY